MSHKRYMVFTTRPEDDRDINEFGVHRYDSDDLESARHVAEDCMKTGRVTSIYDRESDKFVALVWGGEMNMPTRPMKVFAELPEGEIIIEMCVHEEQLIVATNKKIYKISQDGHLTPISFLIAEEDL